MMTLVLNLATCEGQIFQKEILSVTIPSEYGDRAVFAGHAPLFQLIKAGSLNIRTSNEEFHFFIAQGICLIDNNHVAIFTTRALQLENKHEALEMAWKKFKERLDSSMTFL